MNKLRYSFSIPLMSLVLLITLAFAARAQTVVVTKAAPTSSPAIVVIADDTNRAAVTIENVGSVNVGIGGSAVTYAGAAMVLAPNQFLQCVGNNDKMYGIAASSTADLRVIATYVSGQRTPTTPYCTIGRIATTGGAINTAASTTVGMSDGSGNIVPGNVLIYLLTAAITANSTTTATASGTLAITSNATGLGTVFRSDGSKWQLLANYADASINGTLGTIATTSTTDEYVIAPFAGTLTAADFSGIDALTANDTNYITFTITNLGQAGSGSTAMLAATAPNTTQATGGTSIAANTKFALTVSGTGSALIVAKGDRLRVRAAATGTLANTVTGSRVRLYFTRLS